MRTHQRVLCFHSSLSFSSSATTMAGSTLSLPQLSFSFSVSTASKSTVHKDFPTGPALDPTPSSQSSLKMPRTALLPRIEENVPPHQKPRLLRETSLSSRSAILTMQSPSHRRGRFLSPFPSRSPSPNPLSGLHKGR